MERWTKVARGPARERGRADVRPLDHFAILVSLGLVAGAGEVLGTLAHGLFLGTALWRPFFDAWMAPLAAACLFAPVGAAVGCVARYRPSAAWRLSLQTGLFLVALNWLLSIPQLHRASALLLALGLAVRGSELCRDRLTDIARLARLTAAPVCLGLVLAGGAGHILEAARERRALRALVPARAGTPNILLIILDTVRAASLSLYGHPEPTSPYLERWARSGTRFTRAFSTAPWTMPSHASLFTGQLPATVFRGWDHPFEGGYQTLAEALRNEGYATVAVVGNYKYLPAQNGFDRGFLHYDAAPSHPVRFFTSVRLGRSLLGGRLRRLTGRFQPAGRRSAAEVTTALLDWLDGHGQRPFFAFVNYFDAHSPYLPAAPFDGGYGPTQPRSISPTSLERDLSAVMPEHQRNAYEGTIAGLDLDLETLRQELDRRHLLEQTLVIITADHGEQFGEHGLMGHTNSLYLPVLHVPLLFLGPGNVPAGGVVDAPVSLLDVAPTIMDLVGLEPRAPLAGQSLARWWKSESGDTAATAVRSQAEAVPSMPAWMPVHWGAMESVIRGRWHFIRDGQQGEQLYDMQADPEELNSLAEVSDLADTLLALRRLVVPLK